MDQRQVGEPQPLTPEAQRTIHVQAKLLFLEKAHKLAFDPSSPLRHGPALLAEACLALTLINLGDVLAWLNTEGRRIAFTDDLPTGRDVTEHVRRMRNAACHTKTDRELDNSATLYFGHLTRKGAPFTSGETTLANPYDDDVAFFYGSNRIFLVRHIQRAICEAEGPASKIARENGIVWPHIWDGVPPSC